MKTIDTIKGWNFFLIGFLLIAGFGQMTASDIEDLEKELAEATGEHRLYLLDELSNKLSRIDTKRAENLALEGVELANTLQDSAALYRINYNLGNILKLQNRLQESNERIISALNFFKRKEQKQHIGRGNLLLSNVYMAEGKYSISDSLAFQAIDYLKATKDTVLLVNAYRVLGHNKYYRKNYQEANKYYQKCLTIAKSIDNGELISFAFSNLGMIQHRLDHYPEALKYYFKALDLVEDELGRAGILNNIGNVYVKLKDWDFALKYQKEALEIKKKLNLPLQIARSLDNIGLIYKNMLNYGDALKFSLQALSLKEKMEGENKSIENTLNNLGNIYLRLSDFENAFSYYKRSLAVCEDKNNQKGIGRAYNNMALTNFKMGNYQAALSLSLESLDIAQKRKSLSEKMNRNDLLSKIYEELGDLEKSLAHRKTSDTWRDSILNMENLRNIVEIENEQSQKKIVSQNEELKVEGENYVLEKRTYQWILIVISILLTLLIIFFLKLQRKLKAEKQFSTEKLKEQQIISAEKDEILQDQLNQLQKLLLDQSQEEAKTEESTEKITGQQNVQKTPVRSMSNFLIENVNTEKDWETFEHYFTKVHVDFFKQLKTSFPNLTSNELNLCALIRLNLLHNEIGEVMGINSESARKAQYRLAKKMNLFNNDSLRTYLFNL